MPSALEIQILEKKRQLRGYEDQVQINKQQVEKWEEFETNGHPGRIKEKTNALTVYGARRERFARYCVALRQDILTLQKQLANGPSKEAPTGQTMPSGEADRTGDMETSQVVGQEEQNPPDGGSSRA